MEKKETKEIKRNEPIKIKFSTVLTIIICILIIAIAVGAYYYFTKKHEKEIEIQKQIEQQKIEEKRIHDESPIFTVEEYPRIDCSTVLIPMAQKFMSNFTKTDEDKIEVTSTKTDGAYKNLISGKADLILVVDPSEDEMKEAEKAGVELVSYKVANEGFIFFTNTQNKVNNLSLEQIQNIYTGKIKNWAEVGGDNQKIIAYQRPENSGSQTGMLSLVMKDLKLMSAPKENIAESMSAIIDLVSDYKSNPGSIGYSYYYYASSMYGKDELKLLSVNGVKPSNETIKNETYPIKTAYYVVIRKNDENNAKIKKLVQAMLSDRGQKLVEEAGYVAIQ